MKDVNFNDKEFTELLFVSLLILSAKKQKIVPELLYVMDASTFLDLVNVFSGKTIKIPDKKKLLVSLKTVAYYYHVEIKKESSVSVCKKYGINKLAEKHMIRRMKSYIYKLKTLKDDIPPEFRKSELMKGLYNEIWKPKKKRKKLKKPKKLKK